MVEDSSSVSSNAPDTTSTSVAATERAALHRPRSMIVLIVALCATLLLSVLTNLAIALNAVPVMKSNDQPPSMNISSLALAPASAPSTTSTDVTDEKQPTIATSLTSSEVSLVVGGDVMFDTFIYNWISAQGITYPWEDVAPFFQRADLAAVNFESSSSLRGASTKPEGYGFCSPPHTLQGLVHAGIDYVSLGNNHVLDYGREAFDDTLGHLSALEIAYSGAGSNRIAAGAAAYLERNGLKIGLLSYTAIIPYASWWPGEDSPGIAPLYSAEDIASALENIQASKEQCDLLIVFPHWGVEYADAPTAAQRDLARRMIDAGADLILGGHPHVLQGVEFYQGKPIFYSLGNFIFLKMDDDAGKTAVFDFVLDRDGFVSCSLHPVFIDSCKANLLPKDHWMHAEIVQRFARLSADLGCEVSSDGKVIRPQSAATE